MAAVLPFALAAGQGYATYQQGRQQAQSMEAQAQAEMMNAQIAQANREAAGKETAQEMSRSAERKRLIAGQNAAEFGGSGLEMSSSLGQAADRANQSAFLNDLTQLQSNLNAKDWGLRQEVANREYQAASLRSAAKSAKKNAILSGVLTTASTLFNYNNAGVLKKKKLG